MHNITRKMGKNGAMKMWARIIAPYYDYTEVFEMFSLHSYTKTLRKHVETNNSARFPKVYFFRFQPTVQCYVSACVVHFCHKNLKFRQDFQVFRYTLCQSFVCIVMSSSLSLYKETCFLFFIFFFFKKSGFCFFAFLKMTCSLQIHKS